MIETFPLADIRSDIQAILLTLHQETPEAKAVRFTLKESSTRKHELAYYPNDGRVVATSRTELGYPLPASAFSTEYLQRMAYPVTKRNIRFYAELKIRRKREGVKVHI